MTAKRKQNITLEERVLKFIQSNNLIQTGQKVLVAVSGGPDSVCLLHILFKLQKELQISLHIAHLDHALRGAESEGDARYVASLAQKLCIPVTLAKKDVEAYQKTHRLSLEEAAREVRYYFLAETAQAVGAEITATGHTLNDQSETILLHIIRGSGTRGLRGLQPRQALLFQDQNLQIIRPFLTVRHEETVAYCSLHRLSPRTDSTNQSTAFLRNRIRHELLPLLTGYNAGIEDSLLRFSSIAADDLDFLESEGEKAWLRTVHREQGALVFKKTTFLTLAPALQRQILRKAIECLLGTLKDIETRHIEEILDSLTKPAGRCIDLPEELVFCIEYDRFVLGFQPERLSPFPELLDNYGLAVPGTTALPGWLVEATIKTLVDSGNIAENLDAFTAYLDWDKTGDNIKIRSFRRGDHFQPLGLGHEKKLARFMLDARIPRTWRSKVPIFYTPQQILWVAGYRLDERVKITSATRQVLCLKITKT
jgi:tRNA(Ile)-lysidine synthase